MKLVELGGLYTAQITREQLAEKMVDDVLQYREKKCSPKLVFSSNGQGIALAAVDSRFMNVMDLADIIHADGQSVVSVSKLFKNRELPERIATTDFFHDAAKAAQRANISFFMLGATEEDNKKAIENIRLLYPKLRIAGSHNGYFRGKDQDVIDAINSSGADVLWVALGKPYQEYWSAKYRDSIDVAWIKTCGGLYDFLSEKSSRAPMWMQKSGLEWLYRLLQDPRRLAIRYLTTNPQALLLLLFKSGRSREI
jgi:exopolysaccharide biosynthesis WecB/TagA/CpsF family protein